MSERSARLAGVAYEPVWPGTQLRPHWWDSEVSAVRLVFDDGSSRLFRWSAGDIREEALIVGEWRQGDPPVHEAEVDVSDRWWTLLGQRVLRDVWGRQESPLGEASLTVRVDFESGDALMIALGEVIDGVVSYIPDSLVVTGSRDAARAYRPSSAHVSAWGD